MACFKTKNTNLKNIFEGLGVEKFGLFLNILCPFDILLSFFDNCTYLVILWYIFPFLVKTLRQEKSGSPGIVKSA
jgi:hypothetical protein